MLQALPLSRPVSTKSVLYIAKVVFVSIVVEALILDDVVITLVTDIVLVTLEVASVVAVVILELLFVVVEFIVVLVDVDEIVEVLFRVIVLPSNKTEVLCAIEAGATRTPARSSPKHNVTITLLTPLTDGTPHIICSNI